MAALPDKLKQFEAVLGDNPWFLGEKVGTLKGQNDVTSSHKYRTSLEVGISEKLYYY